MTDVNKLATECYKIACEHGWYPEGKERNFGELLALIHSEVSEALESWRNNEPEVSFSSDGKPEGWMFEIADVIIRSFDLLSSRNADVEYLLTTKMKYNTTRTFRHGNKRA